MKDPAELAATVEEAFEIAATGRPGPVVIDIPKNVQIATAEMPEGAAQRRKRYTPRTVAAPEEIAEAMRVYFTDIHNIAEGAGAAPLAALMQERDRMKDRKVGVILSGGNVDMNWYRTVLGGGVPEV